MRWIPLLLALAALPAFAEPAPRVVASIAPLHSIAASVIAGAGEPHLLLPGGSPHTAALRPSQARAIAEADVLLWIGPELEQALVRAVRQLPARAARITAVELPGIRTLPQRRGADWEDGHGHGAARSIDAHLWLDPANARVIALATAEALARRDPARAGLYQGNAAALNARLVALEAEIETALTDLRRTPYLVFHDAYQYWERRFALPALGAVAITPEHSPGARRVADLRARIRDRGVSCVFREPQFPTRLGKTLTAGTAARVAVLDPLGDGLPRGAGQYEALLRQLAAQMHDCLKPPATVPEPLR